MLAAASVEETRALKTFQLALVMAKSQSQVPASLAEYFDEVLLQAKNLAEDPKTANRATLPEAIQLALDIRHGGALRDVLNKLSSFRGLTPASAGEILAGLERPVAAGY